MASNRPNVADRWPSPGGQLFQVGAPRLRASRAATLIHPPPTPPNGEARPRYSSSSTDSFSDEFYHPPRRRSRWSLLSDLFAYPAGMYRASVARFGRRRGPALLCICCLALMLAAYTVSRRLTTAEKGKKVVFGKDEVRKIWDWEVRAGHYPSMRPIPSEVGLSYALRNPSIPAMSLSQLPRPPDGGSYQHTFGIGAQRIYPDVRSKPPDFGHPPRPIPGSIADMDRVLEHCDFDKGKYNRDCHEFLRLGAGLDSAVRLRRDDVEDLRYVYVLDGEGDHVAARTQYTHSPTNLTLKLRSTDNWERDLTLPQPNLGSTPSTCSEDEPRVFHLFWAGAFTDKPYMAILAFLYTQNLGLHLDSPPPTPSYCLPQLWLWINNARGDSMSASAAVEAMFGELRQNPWASPFLHERFKDVIQFRLWNATEQLDSIPELKDDWRKINKESMRSEGRPVKFEDAKRVGSTVSLDGNTTENHANYNKIPVILSDMARFLLCHRYGGVYLDVDMLFLRDWEELWNWPGAFSYRWSREDKYNTAVLRLRRGSVLGSFLLRSALAHGMDFHPVSMTRYLRDAGLEALLFRTPDALFDPAWLNCDYIKQRWPKETVYFQRDRPPQPYFTDFDQFFNTPAEMSAMPSVVGFDGFFRGAFLYHYHNEWWKPFDRARYWPDLGPRFTDAERLGRAAIADQRAAYSAGLVKNDKQDLDWSTVLKRTFEAYIRGERPNMYGEWIRW